jgi:hypothetical protein
MAFLDKKIEVTAVFGLQDVSVVEAKPAAGLGRKSRCRGTPGKFRLVHQQFQSFPRAPRTDRSGRLEDRPRAWQGVGRSGGALTPSAKHIELSKMSGAVLCWC